MGQGLSSIQASDLDKFIKDNLLLDTTFRTEVTAAVDIVCAFLKERCFQDATHPVRVSKVVKGSSSGKGAALKGKLEADLVVLLSNLTSFEDQLKGWREFIKEIEKQLCQFRYEKRLSVKLDFLRSCRNNSPELILKLSSSQLEEEVNFIVLPARDVLGNVYFYNKPDPHIYASLISECTSLGLEGKFSACFTELQGNFLKQRPPKLKSLIRLVKHWYQLCKETLETSLPPQYALELLTVYAWERGSGSTEFNIAEGFRTVLKLVTEYRQLRIYWTVNYDFEHQEVSKYLHRQLRRARPVILDPADPTGNVAGGNPEGWYELAREAKAWRQYRCFRNWDCSTVRSWDVLTEVEVPMQENQFL